MSAFALPTALFAGSLFAATAHAEPLVWKAVKGEQQLMLIGTIHIGEKSMYPLPSQLEQFMNSSDGLVLETNIDEKAPRIDFSQATLTVDAINQQQRKRLESIANELKLDKTVLLHLPPWLTAISIENQRFQSLGYDSSLGVDKILSDQAKALQIPLLTFETVAQQLNMLQDLPQDGKALLVDLLDDQQRDQNTEYQCLIQSWQAGDKEGLLDLLEMAGWEEEVADSLLYQRNQAWSDKIQDPSFLAPNGHYVIGVGALHLIGKHSLIEHLSQQGYQIEQITQSQVLANFKSDCSTLN